MSTTYGTAARSRSCRICQESLSNTTNASLSATWAVELLFEELKQTLQLQSFFGENQNAVEWQIWAAMLTHLVLRYIKWKNKVVSSYTRFAAIIKNTIWLKRSLEAVINFYCIAPGNKCDKSGV